MLIFINHFPSYVIQRIPRGFLYRKLDEDFRNLLPTLINLKVVADEVFSPKLVKANGYLKKIENLVVKLYFFNFIVFLFTTV